MALDLFSWLGSDILESEIFPLLSVDDIKALKATSKTLFALVEQSSSIWHDLYRKQFGTYPTPYTLTKWPDLYKLRSKGKLYVWGTLSGGRLGVSTRDGVPPENFVRRGFAMGLSRPTEVPGINAILADVSAGGFSFQILTDKGEIYSTASYHAGHKTGPGPVENDYNDLIDQARHQEAQMVRLPPDITRRLRLAAPTAPTPTVPHTPHVNLPPNVVLPPRGGGIPNPFDTSIRVPQQPRPLPRTIATLPYVISGSDGAEQDEANNALNGITNAHLIRERAKREDQKFVSISSGRAHFVGLSKSGNIWSWDNRSHLGVQIGFVDSNGDDLEIKGHKVLKVVAGWDSTAAYLYDYGLVYWKDRKALKKDEIKATANFLRVPNTGSVNGLNKVIDFVVGESFLIYLTEEGKIYRNDLINEDSFLLVDFQSYLTQNSNTLSPKFTRLTGTFKNFAVFSNEDLVLIGSKGSNSPIILQELQHKECINVAVGDYHFLGLLRNGTLLSWGKELQACGCLGLGASTTAQLVPEPAGSIRVDKPSVIPIEEGYKVVAIAAGGWQSSAIISKD